MLGEAYVDPELGHLGENKETAQKRKKRIYTGGGEGSNIVMSTKELDRYLWKMMM